MMRSHLSISTMELIFYCFRYKKRGLHPLVPLDFLLIFCNYSAGFICILIKKVLDMVFGDIFKNRLDSQSH